MNAALQSEVRSSTDKVSQLVSGLFCAVLCATIIVHSAMHTHVNRPNSSLDRVLSHCMGQFNVLRFIFMYAACILCIFVMYVLVL